MKYLLSALLLPMLVHAQPTVSNVRIDWITHSSARVTWNLSAGVFYHRILYQKISGFGNELFLQGTQALDLGSTLSGLAPATAYSCEVESSADNSTWSSPVSCNFTTLAAPSPDPALPVINTSSFYNPVPPTSGMTTVNFNSSCLVSTTVGSFTAGMSIFAAVQVATTNQPTIGTHFIFPPAAVCLISPQLFQLADTQLMVVPGNSTYISTSTGTFTYQTIPSGFNFANGQQVIFISSVGCLPGSLTMGSPGFGWDVNAPCTQMGPIYAAQPYYLVNVNSGAHTFGVSLTSGGSQIIPGDTGSPGAIIWLQQFPPQNSNWIFFDTSIPDSQFCPQGVRCMDNVWGSLKPTFEITGGCYNCNVTTNYGIHHIYSRGIRFTATDASSLANTSADPEPTNQLWYTPYSWGSNYIVFDRDTFVCPPFPNRCQGAMIIGGANIALINNDFENIHLWRAASSPPQPLTGTLYGHQMSMAGQVATIIPGVAYLGTSTCTSTSNITFTNTGGSGSGYGLYYFSMTCVPTLALPSGATATCTGTATDANSNVRACSVITATDWPLDTNGGIAGLTLGSTTISSGVASGLSKYDPFGGKSAYSQYNLTSYAGATEGAQAIQPGGLGPYTINNNFMDSTGLHMQFEISPPDPVNVQIRQNSWFWDQKYNRNGSSVSNNFEYANRNGPEAKFCRNCLFDGNILTGGFSVVSATGPGVLFHVAGNNGAGTQCCSAVLDIKISNNTFNNMATAMQVGSNGYNNVTPLPAAARILVVNNLINSSNGFTQIDGSSIAAGNGGSSGNCLELDGPIEDLTVDHNTCANNTGISPVFWHHQVAFLQGTRLTNNLLYANSSTAIFTGEAVPTTPTAPTIGGTGYAFFQSENTQDPNTPGGYAAGNVIVPGYASYTNPSAPTGWITAQSICTNVNGGTMSGNTCPGGLFTNIVNPAGATAPAAVTATGFISAALQNFKLLYNAPCVSGGHCTTDGTDVGVDMNALLTAQGAVETPTVRAITSTSAVISWWAHDGSIACPVDYATAPNDASTQTGGGRPTPSAGNSQGVSLTGLSAGQYNCRVLCPVQQPTCSFLIP